MMPNKFYVPWSDIDPSLQHGGIAGELAEGWVGADLNDNVKTQNRDIHYLVYMLSQFATSISMHPEAELEGFPPKKLVDECFAAQSTMIERVVDVTHTHASKFFSFTHAVPPVSYFKLTPIRYPVRNRFAEDFLHYAIGTLVELAETNRNSVHQGLDNNAANIVVEALWNWKATQMKFWFDIEVAGEISSRELEALYTGVYRPHPSYPDETSARPSDAETSEALSGVDVLEWLPSASDWTKFAELHTRRYVPERALQPEGARPVTEDILPENGTTSGDSDGPAI